MKRFIKRATLGALLTLAWAGAALAQQVNVYSQTGTGTGFSSWLPVSATNPLPVTTSGGGGGNVNVTQWDTTALGVPTAYGVAPTTGNYIGTNSYVTNTVTVTGTGGTFPVTGTVAVTQSTSPWIVAGGGTAGTAASGVLTVQGIASMTPVQVSQATAASLNATVVGTGTFATQSAITAASGALASGSVASGAIASGAIASGAVASGAIASGAFASGSFLNATAGDPCMFQAKTNVPISTASGTTAVVTGVSAKKIYVCSISLVVGTPAVAVSLAEGSSSTCGTSAQAAVMGVATNGTAANGMSFAVNGGLTLGNGGGTVAATATNANYLCLFQSGTTPLAGNLTYVQQ